MDENTIQGKRVRVKSTGAKGFALQPPAVAVLLDHDQGESEQWDIYFPDELEEVTDGQ